MFPDTNSGSLFYFKHLCIFAPKSAIQIIIIVGWKPILYWLFGPKNQSLRNKFGKTQPIWTKFSIRGHGNGWQRSENFGCDWPILGKMGAGTNPAECEFFCLANHTTFQQLCNGRFSPNLVTKPTLVSRRGKTFLKIFTLGVICPENLKSKVSQTGTSLRAGYVSWPNLVKIGRCKVAKRSHGLPHKKTCAARGLVPTPFCPKWANWALNSLNVVTPGHVHVYWIWSRSAVLCRNCSGKIDFSAQKVTILRLSAYNYVIVSTHEDTTSVNMYVNRHLISIFVTVANVSQSCR